MTDLRQAAQQALERLEACVCPPSVHHDIINPLRAALKQQKAEPVAFVNADNLQGLTLGHYGYVEIYTYESAGRVPLYTTPPQQQADPVACPIGLDKKGASQFCSAGYCDACKQQQAEPVHGDIRALKYRIHELEGEVIGYKRMLDVAQAVSQRKTFTDEQDRALCEAYCNNASDEYFKARPTLDFPEMRRIFYAGHRKAWINYETAHGIKEKNT